MFAEALRRLWSVFFTYLSEQKMTACLNVVCRPLIGLALFVPFSSNFSYLEGFLVVLYLSFYFFLTQRGNARRHHSSCAVCLSLCSISISLYASLSLYILCLCCYSLMCDLHFH